MIIINNNQQIVPHIKMLSTKSKIVYECAPKCLLNIKTNLLEPYYYTFYYKVNETNLNEQIIQKGMVDINDISFNQDITLILQEEVFAENVMILVYIKTQDCTISLSGLTKDIIINAYNKNFYQMTFIEKKEYKFSISLDKFDDENNNNPNDSCVYFTYATENDNTESIVITEGVEYQNRFTINQTIINYEFPFVYLVELNTFIIDFEVSESTTIYTKILFENYQTTSQIDIVNHNVSFYFSYNFYSKYCTPNEICKVKIEIFSFDIGGYSKIKIKAKSRNLIYVPQNTIITDMIHNSFLRYFYTNVKNGDKGIIQLLYKFRGVIAFYKVYEKSEIKKNSLFAHNWISVSDYFTGKLSYSIDLPCVNGCILVIMVVSPTYLQQVLTEFSISVFDTTKPVSSPLNERIKGYFDSNNTKYSFIFTLPKQIKQFQIFTKGELTQFVIRDLNEDNPCCIGINHKYEQGKEANFDDYDIEVDTSNYNIVIEITAISPESFDPLISFYEIIVYPIINLDYPIHYIKSNTEIECYTGKNHNTAYFILELVLNEGYDELIIYVDSPQLEIRNFTIYLKSLENQYYHRLPPKQKWTSVFNKDGAETSSIGESFLRIQTTAVQRAELILIEAPVNDVKMNVLVKKISLSRDHYLIPNENNLIRLNPNSVSQIILLNNYHPLISNKYLYFLELEEIIGKGKLYLNNNSFYVKGKQIVSLEHSTFDLNKQMSITIETFDEEFLVKIKFYISKKEEYNLQMFKVYNMTKFEVPSELFPFYLYSYLDDSVNLSFNVKLLHNDNNYYDFSNLEIKGYLTNKESILSFKKNNTLQSFEQINTISINERQLILLNYDKSTSSRSSYDYLFIQINEKNKN